MSRQLKDITKDASLRAAAAAAAHAAGNKQLKDLLKDAREVLGLTLRDAGEKAGVSNAYISQLETGIITTPSPHILYKLANAYKVSYEMLMKAAGYLKPDPGGIQAAHAIALSGTEDLTEQEMNDVLEYIKFVRTRRKRQE
jgi:transcriptional regulator with XRE-family HTH domain